MKIRDKITPEGTKDLLFEEYERQLEAIKTLEHLFLMGGYRKILTPMLEYYDVFAKAAQYLPLDSMYKLIDDKGRLLVLCPDCTIPVARVTATRLKDQPRPLRFYYNHNIYRMEPETKGKSIEVNQIGIELIGGKERKSDFEVVELAADCMEAIGGEQYRLELCHIGYFKAIIGSMNVDEETKENIRSYIEQKNYAALTNLLEPYKGEKAAKALLTLPRLFGGVEVIEKGYELFHENGAKENLDYLKDVYEHLQSLGLGNRVIVDLGLVNQAEYYTGIIFRGYFNEVGEQVLSGGRYDKLLSDFGEESPSVGFGINVDLASKKILMPAKERQKVIVFTKAEQWEGKASSYQKKLRAEGTIAIHSVQDTMEEVIAYAKKMKIPQIHTVGETIDIWRVDE